MLTPHQVKTFRNELDTSKDPLFLFDDDPDGLCSFLLLYRLNREGRGIVIKTLPIIDQRWVEKVREYHPDKLFILDMPIVEQEFIDSVKSPIFWLDHHPPLERTKINYFNPRVSDPDAYIPTSRLAYQIADNKKDMWISMVGCLGDHYLPSFQKEFLKKYPDLTKDTSDIGVLLFDTLVGKLVRVFSFLLKGKTSEMNKCVKILTRIKSPYEILNQETPQGKYIYKRFEKVDSKYQVLLEQAREQTKKLNKEDPLLVFIYTEQSWSFTSELALELIHKHPEKIVIVARKKSGDFKCSIRSADLPISPLLEKALVGINGTGGGHERACGSSIPEEDWDQFLDNLRREIRNARS